MKRLNIITPCSRPENLKVIYDDLLRYTDLIKINWWIVFDKKLSGTLDSNYIPLENNENLTIFHFPSPYENAIGGHLHRNFIFRVLSTQIPEEWCYMLDDDNLIHSKLIDYFVNHDLNGNVLFFSLQRNDGSVMEANLDNIKIGHIDTAMIMFRAKKVNGFKFENRYTSDGEFIEYLYHMCKTEFNYWPVVMAYYNRLSSL